MAIATSPVLRCPASEKERDTTAMRTIFTADHVRYPHMTTQDLRDSFLVSGLYKAGAIQLACLDLDRAVVGMAVPFESPLALPASRELRASFFTERREIGALNIGGPGLVHVEGSSYSLDTLDLDLHWARKSRYSFRVKIRQRSSRILFAQLSGTRHLSRDSGEERRGTTLGTGQRGNLQSPHHLQICPHGRRKKLPTRDGSDTSAQRERLEYYAGSYPHAPFRSLLLFRRCRRCSHNSPGGTTGRDAPSSHQQL